MDALEFDGLHCIRPAQSLVSVANSHRIAMYDGPLPPPGDHVAFRGGQTHVTPRHGLRAEPHDWTSDMVGGGAAARPRMRSCGSTTTSCRACASTFAASGRRRRSPRNWRRRRCCDSGSTRQRLRPGAQRGEHLAVPHRPQPAYRPFPPRADQCHRQSARRRHRDRAGTGSPQDRGLRRIRPAQAPHRRPVVGTGAPDPDVLLSKPRPTRKSRPSWTCRWAP